MLEGARDLRQARPFFVLQLRDFNISNTSNLKFEISDYLFMPSNSMKPLNFVITIFSITSTRQASAGRS